MAINDPGIAVTARPTDAFARAPEPAAFQVAEALAQLNPSLTRFVTQRSEQWIDGQLEEGRRRAIEDAADWHSATVRGEVELGRNPWFRRAYRQQAGQNEGRRIAREATAAYADWADRDSDDPAAFGQWLGAFIRDRSAGVQDADVVAGLTPELSVLTNNLGNAHSAYTSQRVEREGNDALAGAVYTAIDLSRGGPLNLMTGNRDGDFAPEMLLEQYSTLRDRYFAAGMSRTRFDEVFTAAVIDKATNDLDETYLDMLSMPRGDVPPISEKAGMLEVIADARNQIQSRVANRDVRDAQTASALRTQQAQEAFQTYASELLNTGTVSAETRARIAALGAQGVIDPRHFSDLVRAYRTGLSEIDDPLLKQTIEDVPPELQTAAFDRGDVQAVYEAWRDGTITDPGLFNQLVRGAVSRREGEQSQGMTAEGLTMRRRSDSRTRLRRWLVANEIENNGTTPEAAGVEVDADISAFDAGTVTASDMFEAYGATALTLLREYEQAQEE